MIYHQKVFQYTKDTFYGAVPYCLPYQGGHGTGKTGNLAVNFSRQGKQGI